MFDAPTHQVWRRYAQKHQSYRPPKCYKTDRQTDRHTPLFINTSANAPSANAPSPNAGHPYAFTAPYAFAAPIAFTAPNAFAAPMPFVCQFCPFLCNVHEALTKEDGCTHAPNLAKIDPQTQHIIISIRILRRLKSKYFS